MSFNAPEIALVLQYLLNVFNMEVDFPEQLPFAYELPEPFKSTYEQLIFQGVEKKQRILVEKVAAQARG